jgi:hypothetical protein
LLIWLDVLPSEKLQINFIAAPFTRSGVARMMTGRAYHPRLEKREKTECQPGRF